MSFQKEKPLWVRLNFLLIHSCGVLSATFYTLIAFIITYEVIARYIFVSPTIWSEDISLLCQIWATCLGASWALRHKTLIRIDFLTNMFGVRIKKLSDFIALLTIFLFSSIVCYYGYELVSESISIGAASASMLGLPLWITKSAIPIGFGLLSFQAILEMVLLMSEGYQAHEEVSL